MKYLSYMMMVLCACSLHAQRNISNTDGIVYSTPISVLDVMDMGATGTITNLAGVYLERGAASAPSLSFSGDKTDGIYSFQNLTLSFVLDTFERIRLYGDQLIVGTGKLAGANGITGAPDVYLQRDAANTWAQRNGVNAQTSRIYGSYSDSSNYERLSLSHDGSGVGTIGVESGGSGSANQSLKLQVAGNGALYVEGDIAGNARGVNAVDLQIGRSSADHRASGHYSAILGGQYNVASGNGSAVVGGGAGTASGYRSSVIAGELSLAEGSHSSVVGGLYAKAYLYGQHAYASGRFSATGDAQGSRLVARNTTSGTTPADLFLDGVDDKLVLPANTSWGATINIVGRTTDAGTGAEQSGYYELKCLIKRDGASNTTLVGSVTKTVLAEDDATWDVTVSADDTNEALDISCTGGSGDNVRWVATIQLTEVAG